ncbi:PIN domain-containing protein [Pseudooceanicola sediminis]|uniref:PIN domain-containing protein n=1 Tax=Pseudooceanicola sediminis TaxID=2211117 RepID=A0A399J872_9RHOB|nr:PIN domain-containing protein [Pseudooceanicola sediminis]KAA2316806.1 PIN domain-containing protein [Puniceibacterium sp. HSS470]RII40737.1 PIN domain-containing protein [Pseudooceanicola sediminis]|tara:strand:- start:212860 stop:213411 length:552 start_codon:yes stop_codon:yes gene_type:complete
MKALLDACVLYPTVMREMLLGAAGQGMFTPVWSDRILEEWARAAAKLGDEGEAQARAEVAMTRVAFPKAEVRFPAELVKRLWLPDPGDLHVLAAAIASSADAIVTVNAKDFPRHILAEEGLSRADPDALLVGFAEASPAAMIPVATRVLAQARAMSDPGWRIRALMRKARLPRLGKALEGLGV